MSEMIEWLRTTITEDLAEAKIVTPGGFHPHRWRGEDLSPEQSGALTTAIAEAVDADPDDRADVWAAVYAYDRLLGEPLDADCRTDDVPNLLVRNDRRELEHVMRHDPRGVIADCEAKLAIIDAILADCEMAGFDHRRGIAGKTLRLLASAYQHRNGYKQEWTPTPA